MIPGGRAPTLLVARLAAAAACLAAATCGGGGDGPHEDPLVASVRAGIAEQLGLPPARVLCAAGRCDVDLDGYALAVVVAGDRELDWQSDEVLLAAPLVAHIAGEVHELGVDASIDCGPPIQPVPADGRLTCKVGDGGLAWVKLDAAGAVIDVDVALTADEVAARTTAGDEVLLEKLSRALDRPELDDEDAGVGGGAGSDEPDDTGDTGDTAEIDAGAGS